MSSSDGRQVALQLAVVVHEKLLADGGREADGEGAGQDHGMLADGVDGAAVGARPSADGREIVVAQIWQQRREDLRRL